MRISDANAMNLRPAFTRVRVDLYDWDQGVTIRRFDREDIISMSLALNGVETRLDNPELVASTIEAKIYFPGNHNDLETLLARCRASNDFRLFVSIGYAPEAGTTSGDYATRDFYCTADEENMSLEGHILTIKGMDAVGFYFNGKYFGSYIEDLHLVSADTHDTQRLLARYMMIMLHKHPHYEQWTYQDFLGGPSVIVREPAFQDGIYGEQWAYRKAIAQLVNLFRGTTSGDALAKRLVLRDAGAPECRWADTATDGTDVFSLNYNDLSDFTVAYGTPLKRVTLDNPWPQEAPSAEIETISLTAGERTFYNPQFPLRTTTVSAYKVGSPSTSATVESLDSVTYIITAPSDGEYVIRGQRILFIYEAGKTPPNIIINTGNASGDTVELDRFAGLRNENGYYIIENALRKTITECGLKNPRWITFTWRGNPKMQPRDIILLTEKDGTKNYYEIDNLTLELRDGGMTSKVKAIYKCPYTGA